MLTGAPPDAVATFPAAHPVVGDLDIYDDGNEATVAIDDITHGHFNPHDPALSEKEIAARVTDDVLCFLEAMFADRVLLWKVQGGAGGWMPLDRKSDPMLPLDAQKYVWSGPWAG